MKTKHYLSLFFTVSILLVVSCTYELIPAVAPEVITDLPDGSSNNLTGISEETINEIPIDLGEIGVSIDTRSLAILGYKPTTVNLIIGGTLSSYSKEGIDVNVYTHVADFKLSRADLSEEVLKGFSNGVEINVAVLDNDGNVLENKTISRYIINSTPRAIKIASQKSKILKPLSFNANVPYYVQVTSDTDFNFLSIPRDGSSDFVYYCADYENNAQLCANERALFHGDLGIYEGYKGANSFSFPEAQFYFEKTPTYPEDSSYYIKSVRTLGSLFAEIDEFNDPDKARLLWSRDSIPDDLRYFNDATTIYNGYDTENKFVLEQTAEGTIKIRMLSSEKYLKSNRLGAFKYSEFSASTADDLEFIIISADIEWEFNDLGTKYSPAIIPPAKMDFAFAQTILNCSGATGDYEVGVETVRTKSTEISFDESLNLFSSKTDGKSVTVGVEAEGKIFGVGVKASIEGTLSNESTTEYGKTKETSQGSYDEEVQTVSIARNITVPEYSAIEVFDAIQTWENIQIPFVQRFIIRGAYGEFQLTGSEIEAQLIANSFGGVVTEIGSDFLVVSVRGTVNVANYFEFTNNLNDLPGVCN
tara:strand:- start:32859 stop:34622 length:1764 start_codon:yes stop_codon:yes gene_type:complete